MYSNIQRSLRHLLISNVGNGRQGKLWNACCHRRNDGLSMNLHEGTCTEASHASETAVNYFDFHPVIEKIPNWKTKILKSMLIYTNFITEEEQTNIMLEIEPYMSRLHYETSHWDDAIHDYRETERKKWNIKNTVVINRIRKLAFPPSVPQLQLVHVLDLAKKGVIKPHIDSVRFCGNTIAGLSLLSDSVMRLRHDAQKDHICDVYLPRFSLYIMNNIARYEFTHEILGEKESMFQKKVVPRERRISIMCRNEPEITMEDGPTFKTPDQAQEQ